MQFETFVFEFATLVFILRNEMLLSLNNIVRKENWVHIKKEVLKIFEMFHGFYILKRAYGQSKSIIFQMHYNTSVRCFFITQCPPFTLSFLELKAAPIEFRIAHTTKCIQT